VVGVVDLPTTFIESVIAGSILVAAILNVLPRAPATGWLLAFGFGLFHGLGFASALGGLGVGGTGVLPSLLGFNLGVEAGQLLLVLLALPVLLALGRVRRWRYPLVATTSVACGAVGAFWLVERIT
jgi:hypothetical protein